MECLSSIILALLKRVKLPRCQKYDISTICKKNLLLEIGLVGLDHPDISLSSFVIDILSS